MFYVYIVHSSSAGRYYIGSTADIESRLGEHNDGEVRSTKAYRPWKLVSLERFESKTAALKREKQIKSYNSGSAFKKLLERVTLRAGTEAVKRGRL